MDVNDTNKHNPIIARTLNQMATTSAPTLPHVTMSAANVAATGEGTDINAFDATQVWLNKEEMLEARISEFQARGLRSIIIMLFKKAKTSTALYHLVAKFRLASTPPSFHSTSDFHHTLMTTYKHWTRCVQRAHTTWRRERSSRERSDGTCVVPESTTVEHNEKSRQEWANNNSNNNKGVTLIVDFHLPPVKTSMQPSVMAEHDGICYYYFLIFSL